MAKFNVNEEVLVFLPNSLIKDGKVIREHNLNVYEVEFKLGDTIATQLVDVERLIKL